MLGIYIPWNIRDSVIGSKETLGVFIHKFRKGSSWYNLGFEGSMVNDIIKYGGGGVTLSLFNPDGHRAIANSLDDRFTNKIHILITYLVILQENWRRQWRITGFLLKSSLKCEKNSKTETPFLI